ncbi:MAG: delta-60 repeat domain-containing protein [Actinomycetota bacterium]
MKRKVGVAAVTAVLFVVVAGPACAAPGSLDSGFSGDGKAVMRFTSGSASAEAVAMQADGKVVTAGWVDRTATNEAWALVRYRSNGRLDTSFGNNGRAVTDWTPGDDEAWGVVVLGTGKIVAGGYAGGKFAAARYTPAGVLDQSFGDHGKVTIDFTASPDSAWDVAVSEGGRILLAGQSGATAHSRFALVRLNGNGTLDHTFGGDGKVTESVFGGPSYVWDVVVRADGSIVATGNQNGGAFDSVAIAAFHPNGSPDSGFGDAGAWIADAPNNAYANAIVRLPSGKYMVGASVQVGSDQFDVGLFRFGANGHLDTSFGTNGLVARDFASSEFVTDMQRSGSKLVISIERDRNAQPPQMAIVRLLAGGAPDTGFGNLGLASAGLPDASGEALAVQQDGKPVVAGDSNSGAADRFAVARFLAT